MILTIGQHDAPKEMTIVFNNGQATANIPQSVDPGPFKQLTYSLEVGAEKLIVDDAACHLLHGPSGGILSLMAGSDREIGEQLGMHRTAVNAWVHGRKEMRLSYRLLALWCLGLQFKGGLWTHPDLSS